MNIEQLNLTNMTADEIAHLHLVMKLQDAAIAFIVTASIIVIILLAAYLFDHYSN